MILSAKFEETDSQFTAEFGEGLQVNTDTKQVDSIIDGSVTDITTNATKIAAYVFYNQGIKSITMPNVTTIGDYAFSGCSNLNMDALPKSLFTIGSYGFRSCSSLTIETLPRSLINIFAYAFSYCSALKIKEIPSSVNYIGSRAFLNCQGLESITFKGKPSSLASTAFSNCTNLTEINVPWAEGEVADAPWGATNATINYNYK